MNEIFASEKRKIGVPAPSAFPRNTANPTRPVCDESWDQRRGSGWLRTRPGPRVRYEVFIGVQNRYSINPFWLSDGKGSPTLDNFDDTEFSSRIKPRALFTDVFDGFLRHKLVIERVVREGREAYNQVLADFGSPAAIGRLKKVRVNEGIDLEWIAHKIPEQSFDLAKTVKTLEDAESGKQLLLWR